MVQLPDEIKKLINRYLDLLSQNNILVQEAFIFGSYATGVSNPWSDIDIALVSDIFEGDRIEDKNKIRKITLSVSSSLEVVPFAPNDFNSYNPFANEIMRTGIKLI